MSDAYITRTAAEISAEYAAEFGSKPKTPVDPRKWVAEGVKLAKQHVYTFGLATGSKEMPLQLPEKYEVNARRVARKRIAEAGLRMAAVLNARFR